MKNKFNIYMYPMWEHEFLKTKHPYVYNLSSGLSDKFNILNLDKASKRGLLDIASYFFKTDIIYLNWIENVRYRKGIIFLLFLILFKICGKKVIWTHHNLSPHKGDSRLSKFIRRLLTKYADLIIVHTKESFKYLNITADSKQVFSFFHPVFSDCFSIQIPAIKKIDLLIWGNVRESKGVHQFLAYLSEKNKLGKYRIKVIGKFANKQLYEKISKYAGDTICIEDGFIDYKDLNSLHEEAKFVFFPYSGKSVLNSGALITSLPKGTPIIGPCVGAFSEMGELGLINLYKDFDDVLNYVDNHSAVSYPYNLIKKFCLDHTWENFTDSLYRRLNES